MKIQLIHCASCSPSFLSKSFLWHSEGHCLCKFHQNIETYVSSSSHLISHGCECSIMTIYLFIYGCTSGIWRFPGEGLNQHTTATAMQDPSMSLTFTTSTVHSNAISLIHWLGPWIKYVSSCVLVSFTMGTPGITSMALLLHEALRQGGLSVHVSAFVSTRFYLYPHIGGEWKWRTRKHSFA